MVAFGEPFSALLARGFSSGSSPKCCNKEKEEVAEEKDATQDGSNTNRLSALPTVRAQNDSGRRVVMMFLCAFIHRSVLGRDLLEMLLGKVPTPTSLQRALREKERAG